MFVLEVIPFSRTAPAAPLSYRSRTSLSPGTLVSIPLRKKTVLGLVLASRPVQEAKAELKTASYSLSKSSTLTQGTLPAYLIKAAEKTAAYHATTLGSALTTLLIPVLPDEFPSEFKDHSSDNSQKIIEKIEAPFIKRIELYKAKIATTKRTTVLVVPTQVEAEEWAEILKEHKPVVISGKLTGKRRAAALARASSSSSLKIPRIIISTPTFAWVPVPFLDHIIIERVSAGGYQLPKRPYIDMRIALTELAHARGIPITYGDYPLPLEYRDQPEVSIGHNSRGTIQVIDTRAPKTEVKKETSTWQALPDILRAEIQKTLDSEGRIGILAARKGYSPTVVCRDCGTTVTDEYGRILSLATKKGVRVYRSNDGRTSDATEVFCKVCGGWNLSPLGIGIERIEEEVRSAFPDVRVVRIDQDSNGTSSLKKIREKIAEPSTIILGTELMLPYLSVTDSIDLGIIASADSLLALPFWRARERFVRIGLMLGERSKRTIVATRHPEDAALSVLANPEDNSFWKEETGLRKILSYPPFGTLIIFHIESISGDTAAAHLEEARALIRAACAPYIPLETSEQKILSKGKLSLRSSLVLQLPEGFWPNSELSQKLSGLPPSIRIHIDSEMLW